jgi:predicted acylesterase/phospholipase RssA
MELTDGGLISNIPVEVARDMKMDIIIAVDVSSPLRTASQLNAPWEIADQIINIMAQLPNKQSLEKATIVITPDLGGHLATDFSGLDSLIAEGEGAAETKMPALLDSIQEKQSANYFSGPNVEQLSFKISAVSFQGPELPQNIKADLASLTAGEKVTIGFIKEKVS